MKNLLFITWDGPQTSYMEGLFMPIFHEIAKKGAIQFHVIQFTWANKKKTAAVKKEAESLGIYYTAFPIIKKPLASLGSFFTLLTSSKKIEKYIRMHDIDTIMPRNVFIASMVNRINTENLRIIYDSDGLQLEERIDFAKLSRKSQYYKFFRNAEKVILLSADAVITRSQKAIDIQTARLPHVEKNKFFVVKNGRNANFFSISAENRKKKRKSLEIEEGQTLFLYAGSLGPQYCLKQMLEIFTIYNQVSNSKMLILTGDVKYAEKSISPYLRKNIMIKSVAFTEVAEYMNAADIAFALREPSFSMQAVAPIKLGEYMLTGLPVIASSDIGDTDEILKDIQECFLFKHSITLQEQIPQILEFIQQQKSADRKKIREFALPHFSLQCAAESYETAINFLTK